MKKKFMKKSKKESNSYSLLLWFCVCVSCCQLKEPSTDVVFDLVAVLSNYCSDSLMQEKIGYPSYRQLILIYKAVNRSDSDVFIPLHRLSDDFKTHLSVTYKNEHIDFENTSMGDGIVKAQDSAFIDVSFMSPSFENIGIGKEVRPEEIVRNIKVEYVVDESDTAFAHLPIKKTSFNTNTSPRYLYKDSDDDAGNGKKLLLLQGGYDENEIYCQ